MCIRDRLTTKSPKEWTEKTSGVIMDILIVEDKFVETYNVAIAMGVINAPKIGKKSLENWKLDIVHNKSNKKMDEDDDN